MVDHGPPSSNSSFNYQPYPAEYQRNHPPPGFNNNNNGTGPSRQGMFPPPPPPPSNNIYRPFPPGPPPPPNNNSNSNLGRNKYPPPPPSFPAPPLPPPPPSHGNNHFSHLPPPPPTRDHTFGPQARMGDGGLPPPPTKRAEKKQAIAPNKPSDDPPVMRVANVPDNTTVEDIRLLFQRFGGIVKIQMWKSTRLKNTNAYVTIKDHSQLNKILAQFDRVVKLKSGIWARFSEKGYKCALNVPTGNEWFKYEAPTVLEWSTPSLPTDGPSRDVPSSSTSGDAAALPLGYDDDSKPLPSSSALLPPRPSDDDGPIDGAIRAHRRSPVATGEPDPQIVKKEVADSAVPKSRKRRGSWKDEASLPPAARDRGDEGDRPYSRSRSPGSSSRRRSDSDAGAGGGVGGGAGSTSSASVAGVDAQASVPGPSTMTAPPHHGRDNWVSPPSPSAGSSSSRSRGRTGRSISPATSDRGRNGRVLSGKGSSNSSGIPPSSSSRQPQPQSNQSSPSTTVVGGPSNYERTPAPSSSGGLVSPNRQHGGRQQHQHQHQRNPSNASLPHLGPTTSASSSSSSLLSNPSTAPYPPPPPPFVPAPNTDADLVQRLHELETLLTASRDQSSQIYHHLLSTESSLLALANTVLTAQQSQKRIERERDEALSWRNEVERRMGTVLGVLEEVGGRSLREGVERGLEEGRRGEREVEGELYALMDVDEREGFSRGGDGRVGWDAVESLVRRAKEQEMEQDQERERERERGRRR